MKQNIIAQFTRHFGCQPEHVIRSPGRVNLIGEHTDYNDGFVLPMAIEPATVMAIRPRDDRMIRIISEDFEEESVIDLAHMIKDSQGGWSEYIKGMAWAIQQELGVTLQGFDAFEASNVPIGAGLSSSASFELAIGKALSLSSDLPWDAVQYARLAQLDENQWVGVNCGIMDQLICATGKQDHAVLIDCEDLSIDPVPLPQGVKVVILDTSTRRGLVDSKYNERRSACEHAAQHFNVAALRAVSQDQLERSQAVLGERVYRRAKHVVTENDRVLAAAKAMRANDAKQLGQLMNASHASLDRDFEVTNDALNMVVDIAQNTPGCLGARMTGAGFGGCAVALVADEAVEHFVAHVSDTYAEEMQLEPKIYVTSATDGCAEI